VKESTKDRAKVKSHDEKGKRKQKLHGPPTINEKRKTGARTKQAPIENEIGEAEEFGSEEDL
jgi:hypothetical protein